MGLPTPSPIVSVTIPTRVPLRGALSSASLAGKREAGRGSTGRAEDVASKGSLPAMMLRRSPASSHVLEVGAGGGRARRV